MPSKRYAYARDTTLIVDRTGRWNVRAGEVWYADHPVVAAHPDLFSDVPLDVKPRGWEPPVEQASSAPGEKRSTRRAG